MEETYQDNLICQELVAALIAGAGGVPVNHWLIFRGQGPAVVPGSGGHHGH
jgi:hypothetical protein